MERVEYEAMAQLEDEHWWFKGKRAVARSLLGPFWKRGARVLDVGCGTGGTTAFMEEAGAKVLGCELNPVAAAFASKRLGPQGAVVRGRAEALPVRSGSMDFVTAFDVLYHRDVDESAALAEWRRVLAPGGLLYVSDSALPCLKGPHDDAVHGRERYTAPLLAGRVRMAGFDVLKVTYWNFLLFPLAAAHRLARRLQGATTGSDLTGLPPFPVNECLVFLLETESQWLRWFRFPIGTSVALVARKT